MATAKQNEHSICHFLPTDTVNCCFFSHRNRKKIAKYKAAASLVQKCGDEELRSNSQLRDDSNCTPPSPDTLLQGNKVSSSNGEVNKLEGGNVVLTWKDGNTSYLYSDPEVQEEDQEEKQE